jgi:hypothetical protein
MRNEIFYLSKKENAFPLSKNVDVKKWFGRTEEEGEEGDHQVRRGVRSSLGGMIQFKSIDLSKSSGKAMKRDRHQGRRRGTGIGSKSLLPGETPMRTL